MKVVGLVSGGKDSVFAMMECVRHGHEIVALANLAPANSAVDELDSWMFQTVGHNAVEALSECMQLPLFRGTIQGGSVSQGLDYSRTEKDEVEDLFKLLQRIQTALPSVEAVSSGAILSTYQRVRVENVCQRLGLVSLSYLWQREQRQLLSKMVASGVQAVLVKTAAMGLVPARHLGRSIQELLPFLTTWHDTMGCNACGEGGEYETFTLDCPLFHKRVVVDAFKNSGDLTGDIAPVAHRRFTAFHLQPKSAEEVQQERKQWLDVDQVGPSFHSDVLEDMEALQQAEKQAQLAKSEQEPGQESGAKQRGQNAQQHQPGEEKTVQAEDDPTSADSVHVSAPAAPCVNVRGIRSGQYLCITAQAQTLEVPCAGDQTAAELARKGATALFGEVGRCLEAQGVGWSDVVHVNIYLADMALYAAVNAVYSSLFEVNPPSRAAVQLALPRTVDLCAELLVALHPGPSSSSGPLQQRSDQGRRRRALHVQSVSDWAPSNIGPYSQATDLRGGVLLLAGQIGLVPGSMKLAIGLPAQVLQAMTSCCRVLHVMGSRISDIALLIVWIAPSPGQSTASLTLSDTLRSMIRALLSSAGACIPVLFLCVPSLPKGALVELQIIAYTGGSGALGTRIATEQFGSSATGLCVRRLEACARRSFISALWSVALASGSLQGQLMASALDATARVLVRQLVAALGATNISWSNLLYLRVFYDATQLHGHVSGFRAALEAELVAVHGTQTEEKVRSVNPSQEQGGSGGPAAAPPLVFGLALVPVAWEYAQLCGSPLRDAGAVDEAGSKRPFCILHVLAQRDGAAEESEESE